MKSPLLFRGALIACAFLVAWSGCSSETSNGETDDDLGEDVVSDSGDASVEDTGEDPAPDATDEDVAEDATADATTDVGDDPDADDADIADVDDVGDDPDAEPCPDSDDDGVCDDDDVCPGADDGMDGDDDSVPDECDVCADADDTADDDMDGVPDGCDVCAGENDAMDVDGDGIPNGCDECNALDDTDMDGVVDDCDVCDGDDATGDTDMDMVCDDIDPDIDGDMEPNETDCAPADPAAFNGAEEVCDGIDNDCDDVVDGADEQASAELCAGPLEFCGDGCEPYPDCPMEGCGDGTSCSAGVCIPSTVDLDEDGVPAELDCDETNGAINPDASEVCNGIDDDCVDGPDDGDAAALCAEDPDGNICTDGACACALDVPEGHPTCDVALNLGDFPDDGSVQTVIGTIPPLSDEVVWYRFRGVDLADNSSQCDNYHVRVRMLSGEGYAFDVYRGGCGSADHLLGISDYTDAQDFSMIGPGGETLGQCPCVAGACPSSPPDSSTCMANPNNPVCCIPGRLCCNLPGERNSCDPNSSDYFVAVYMRDPPAAGCEPFVLEISNGLYDSF